MPAEPRTMIKDIEELREFIRMNKRKEDYFDHIVERVISSQGK